MDTKIRLKWLERPALTFHHQTRFTCNPNCRNHWAVELQGQLTRKTIRKLPLKRSRTTFFRAREHQKNKMRQARVILAACIARHKFTIIKRKRLKKGAKSGIRPVRHQDGIRVHPARLHFICYSFSASPPVRRPWSFYEPLWITRKGKRAK